MISTDLKALRLITLRAGYRNKLTGTFGTIPKVAGGSKEGDPMYSITALCGNKPLANYRSAGKSTI